MASNDDIEVVGGCHCGRVRFRIAADCKVMLSTYCHCSDCRKANAATLYQAAYVEAAAFDVTQGEADLKWYSHDPAREHLFRRHFCTNCGTKVFNTLHEDLAGEYIDWVGAFASLFDDPQIATNNKWRPPMHIYAPHSLLDLSLLHDGLTRHPALPSP